MSEPTLWWLLTGAIVAIELLTGTFYLLMLAAGAVAAALAAHAGATVTTQLVLAAVVGGGAVAEWSCRGLQNLVRRFDSGPCLQFLHIPSRHPRGSRKPQVFVNSNNGDPERRGAKRRTYGFPPSKSNHMPVVRPRE